MKTAYIGIGSNLGDKLDNCLKAISLVDRTPGCRVMAQSSFYSSEPVGVKDQDWYVNGAFSLKTEMPAQDLLRDLLAIEKDMGRVRKKKWDSRTIDLDIVLFGQDVINENGLTVPHPQMHLRRFVLEPMVQLAPDFIHPVLGKTLTELLNNFPEKGQALSRLAEV